MSRAEYETFFAEADTDDSGSLTFNELLSMLRSKGYRGSEAEIREMFAKVDTSGDGLISKEEYMVAMGQQPPKVHGLASMRRVFLSFDKDGNGSIDKHELKEVFRELRGTHCVSDKEMDRLIKQFDDDNSGALDYEEFLKHVFGVQQ